MKTLYLDCSMGAAGDMLAAALLELLPQPLAFLRELNMLGIPGVYYSIETLTRHGVTGTHLRVTVNGEEEGAHTHTQSARTLRDIRSIVYALPLPTQVKLDVLAVYAEIAEAESHAHNCPVEYVHFHEVGAMDAVADITAVCLLMSRLAPEQVLASPIALGSGTVRCAHGILPVPAPATAYLVRSLPTRSGPVSGELCTPTGAALLRHFVDQYTESPAPRAAATGRGMGTRDFGVPGALQAMLYET